MWHAGNTMGQFSFLLIIGFVSLASSYGSPWTSWKSWYLTKLKPCLRICPRHPQTEFVCGYDIGRGQYAIVTNRCILKKHNACYGEDYQEVPVEKCLESISAHTYQTNPILQPSSLIRILH